MGQKTHPIGFRLGVIKDWQSKWYAGKSSQYRTLLLEDLRIRRAIFSRLPDASISKVELERGAQELVVTIHSARPGIVIGRGGQRVEDVRRTVEELSHKRARLNVQEVRQPELDAQLVAMSIAEQLGRRIAFRRAMHQSVDRAMQSGANGIKIICSGRLGGIEIARREKVMEGRVPLHTLRADIDYGLAEARTAMGRIGVKVWIYKGDILPELKKVEAVEVNDEEMKLIEVTVGGQEEESSEESRDATTEENQIPKNA
jgi:small subunit ribosomal protein S3